MEKLPKVEWKSLKWLVGEVLKAERFPHEDYMPDGGVVIVGDYDNTVLFEALYEATHGWPVGWCAEGVRRVRYMIPKASLYNGDVRVKRKTTGEYVTGKILLEGAML